MMKVATVFESSDPVSMIRRQRGMISVESRKLMTSVSSTFDQAEKNQNQTRRNEKHAQTLTRAPITPKLVSRKYSNGRWVWVVFKKGYRKRGTWAFKKRVRVSV